MNTKMITCLVAAALLSTVSIAGAQQAKKIPRIGYLSISSPPLAHTALNHSGKACGMLATSRGKTSSLNGDLQRVELTGYLALTLPPSWYVSRWT